MNALKKSKGFSLIEVLVGLVVLALGLIAVAGMQMISMKGNVFSNGATQATILAQDKLEYLKQSSYSDSNLSSGQHNEGSITGTIFSRQYNIVEDVGNSMKTITVTVQWTDKVNHSISLSTIRADQ
jgi:type IV pilus assembly protein PilV